MQSMLNLMSLSVNVVLVGWVVIDVVVYLHL
jgi:hypothetical protein